MTWEIKQDPIELRLFGITTRYEYEPGEYASVWIAREVSKEHANLIAASPVLLAACKEAIWRFTEETEEQWQESQSYLEAPYHFLWLAINKAEGKT